MTGHIMGRRNSFFSGHILPVHDCWRKIKLYVDVTCDPLGSSIIRIKSDGETKIPVLFSIFKAGISTGTWP